MDRFFTSLAQGIAHFAGSSSAFLLALLFIAVWAMTGPIFGFSDTWQLVVNTATTIVTFLMVFLIQNSQNRDAAAMQAKLDEIILALSGARNKFIGVEHLTEEQVERIRKAMEEENGIGDGEKGLRDRTVDQLLERL